jgi:predicted metal-dependent HD superfamily phosphohydrolase
MINIHDPNEYICEEVKKFKLRSITTLMLNGIKSIESAEEITNAILEFYSGRNRFYHTFIHINKMFDNSDKYFPNSSGGSTLESPELLAILFHDIIYVPGQIENEQRSIDLMISIMAGYGVPLSGVDWASRIIHETSNHLNNVTDESTYAVLDLDLSALAEPYLDFEKQNKLIDKEFGNNVDSEERKKFFQKLLDKNIFYKLWNLEKPAKDNISKYIKTL